MPASSHTSPLTPPHTRPRTRAAFTLTELLVVIALIVLLVTLLLTALSQVQAKSRETSTLATMQAFSNACEAFHQEHGFYPGAVPGSVMVKDAIARGGTGLISDTENAILSLAGGYAREEDDQERYDVFNGAVLGFNNPPGNTYLVKAATDQIGDGPVIDGRPFAPYFSPGDREFGVVNGQAEPGDLQISLPDLKDAWGQPIIYLRRLRSVGPLVTQGGAGAGPLPQFDMRPMNPYLQSTGLGKRGEDQLAQSILNTADNPSGTVAKIIEHSALRGQARGAYMLLSAGPDGVYFSRTDGAGSPGDPVDDLVEMNGEFANGPDGNPYTHKIFDDYDDVLTFGGS